MAAPGAFGCWWIDEKTGKKIPGVSPRNETKTTKPAKPAKAKEK